MFSPVILLSPPGKFIAAQDTRIHNIGGDPTGQDDVDDRRQACPFTSTALCLVDPRSSRSSQSIVSTPCRWRIGNLRRRRRGRVINIVLKRGYNGAITQFRVGQSTSYGGLSVMGSQLFGKTWDAAMSR